MRTFGESGSDRNHGDGGRQNWHCLSRRILHHHPEQTKSGGTFDDHQSVTTQLSLPVRDGQFEQILVIDPRIVRSRIRMTRGEWHFTCVNPVLAVLNVAPKIWFDTSPCQEIGRDQRQQCQNSEVQPARDG